MRDRAVKAILVVLVIVLGATSARLWLRDRPAPSAADAARTGTAPAETGIADVDADPARAAGDLGTGLPRIDASEDSSDTETTRESRAGGSESALQRRLAQNAEYVEARRKFMRHMASGRYPDIERVLKLSPEAADRLLDVLANHRAPYGARVMEDPDFDPAASALARQEREYALNSAVTGVIGEAKMADFEQYMGSLYERYEIRGLQFELMNSPHPLEFEDAEPVIEAMYEERQRIERELKGMHGPSEENDRYPPAFVVDGKVVAQLSAGSNRRILDAATRHLSPPQAEYFRRSLDDVAELNRLGDEIRRMRSDAKAAPRT